MIIGGFVLFFYGFKYIEVNFVVGEEGLYIKVGVFVCYGKCLFLIWDLCMIC